jgi:hypothetical protein
LIEEELMRRKFFGYAMASAILAGCSSSPSDGDVKQVVEGMLGGCPNFSIEKFKKVNGVAAGEGRYAVEVVFTVKVAPVSGAKELLETAQAELAASKDQLAEAMSAKAKVEEIEREYTARIAQAKQSQDRALESSLVTQQMNFDREKIKLLDAADKAYMASRYVAATPFKPVFEKFYRDCPNVHPMIQVYESNKPDQFTTTFTKDFAGTLPLVKTDNGWRGAF